MLLFLAGCLLLDDADLVQRRDPDGDGVVTGLDCDDGDAAVGGPADWFLDEDADGYGVGAATAVCVGPSGYASAGGDCNDREPLVNPGAAEVCNDADDDCDGALDDEDPGVQGRPTWYPDEDRDTWGDEDAGVAACAAPTRYVSAGGDCDDADAAVNPGADEICDEADSDCDDRVDEDAVDAEIWYADADRDGYGDDASGVSSCEAVSGRVPEGGDCNDADRDVNPGRSELCDNGVDDDCDGGANGCALEGEVSLEGAAARLEGRVDEDRLGERLVFPSSDLDGDGLPDFTVGGPRVSELAGAGGGLYVVPGTVRGQLEVPNAAGFFGSRSNMWAGQDWTGRLDVNADGAEDLVVGAPRESTGGTYAGAVYIALGPITSPVSDADADYATFGSTAGGELGAAVGPVGDQDGDGAEDGLVAADLAGSDYGGLVYIVSLGHVGSTTDLTDLAIAAIDGEASYGYLGAVAEPIGDFDGDGTVDLCVGASRTSPGGVVSGGEAFLFLGPLAGSLAPGDADSLLRGAANYDRLPTEVVGGDLDEDGYSEWVVGGGEVDEAATDDGVVAILYGSPSRTVDVSVTGVLDRVWGKAGDKAGSSVAVVPDVSGDGRPDLVLGVPNLREPKGLAQVGAAVVVPGPVRGGSELDKVFSAVLWPPKGDGVDVGARVNLAGDVNASGGVDLLVADPFEPGAGSNRGAVYLVLTGGL